MTEPAVPLQTWVRQAMRHGRAALQELDAALTALEEAGAHLRATEVTEGRTMLTTATRVWRQLRQLPRGEYTWPEDHGGHEIYEPLDIYEADDGLELAVGYNTRLVRVWGGDHKHIWIFRPGPNGTLPGDPIATFLSADDFEETGEYVAYIKGKGATGKQHYGPGDTLPPEYGDMKIQIHRDRIARSYIKFCVVAHEDDVAAMLNHAAAQIAIRGL
jgi:hypothetical protein